ncbi:C40 family peptidase [Actinomycetes bacterium KLBMP 9797]
MAKRKGRHQARRDGVIGPALRPIAYSAMLSAAVAAAFATPVYAAPPAAPPDAGSRPAPAGSLQMPGTSGSTTGGGTGTGTTGTGTSGNTSLAVQLQTAEIEVATLGEELRERLQQRDQSSAGLVLAQQQLQQARAALAQAEAAADSAAAEAFKRDAELPPGMFGSDLQGLRELQRIQRGEGSKADTEAADREVFRAKDAERVALDAYNAALASQQQAATAFTTLQATYKAKEAAYAELVERNATQVAAIEEQQEAEEQARGAQYLNNDAIAGLKAHPKALAALDFALDQMGKRYVWGTEGPNTYDCSGLMWAAYRSAGYYQLPRVSRDQYYATRQNSVSRSGLLPGDLVFFASGTSWTSIHHVGMYLGSGMMVHAPNSRSKVKVSSVQWSRFFGATRIYGAVPAPTTPPTTPPPTSAPPTTPPPTSKPPTKPPTSKPPTTPPTTPPSNDPTTPPTTPPTTTPTTPPTTDPTTPSASPTPDPPSTSTASSAPASSSASSSASADATASASE